MAARLLSFTLLTSLSVATAILVYDGTLLAPAPSQGETDASLHFELRSVVFGLALGVVIGQLASIRWSRLPDHVVEWCLRHGATVGHIILAIIFGAILIYM